MANAGRGVAARLFLNSPFPFCIRQEGAIRIAPWRRNSVMLTCAKRLPEKGCGAFGSFLPEAVFEDWHDTVARHARGKQVADALVKQQFRRDARINA